MFRNIITVCISILNKNTDYISGQGDSWLVDFTDLWAFTYFVWVPRVWLGRVFRGNILAVKAILIWKSQLLIVGSLSYTQLLFTGVHSNQDQIWLVKIGQCIGFMLMAGPDYYGPPWQVLITMVPHGKSWLLWSPMAGSDYYGPPWQVLITMVPRK